MKQIHMKVLEFEENDINSFQDFCSFIKNFITKYFETVNEIDMDPMSFFCYSPGTLYFVVPLEFSREDKIPNFLSVKEFCRRSNIDYLGCITMGEMRKVGIPSIQEEQIGMYYHQIKEFFDPVDVVWVQCVNFKTKEIDGFGWELEGDTPKPLDIGGDNLGKYCTFYDIFVGDDRELN